MWAAALTEPPPLIGHLGMDVHIGMMTRCAQHARSSARQSGEARRAATGARGSREQHGCRHKGKTRTGKAYFALSIFFSCPLPAVPRPLFSYWRASSLERSLSGLRLPGYILPAEALLRIAHAMRGMPNPNPKPNPKPTPEPEP